MAAPGPPPLVKLICGMLSGDPQRFERAVEPLEEAFGPVGLVGEVMDFDATDYYEPAMGAPLFRRFVSFANPVAADDLVAAKLATNAIEARFAADEPSGPDRPINLDPGYVDEPKLVLASMKDAPHRVYLARGVYAQVTLLYRGGAWRALEWTFPDYAATRYHAFFSEVRERLREERKEGRE